MWVSVLRVIGMIRNVCDNIVSLYLFCFSCLCFCLSVLQLCLQDSVEWWVQAVWTSDDVPLTDWCVTVFKQSNVRITIAALHLFEHVFEFVQISLLAHWTENVLDWK